MRSVQNLGEQILLQNFRCYSYVGRQGGRQRISLENGACDVKGIAIHEMLHALGFFHEHNRSDRDDFITIVWKNVNKSQRNLFCSAPAQLFCQNLSSLTKRPYFSELKDQFTKLTPIQEDTLGAPYDYGSLMHYSKKAFTKNGKDTMIPKPDPK